MAPRPNGGARVQALGPEELWPIGMRIMPDLSMIRGNQAGSDGPRLLSELDSQKRAENALQKAKMAALLQNKLQCRIGRNSFAIRLLR